MCTGRQRNRFGMSVAFALCIAFVGILSAQDLPVVMSSKATRGNLERKVKQAGTLLPLEKVSVYARATGYLLPMKHDVGDVVGLDQVIARIDAPELEAESKAKKAALDTALAMIEMAKAKLGLKDAALQLTESLYSKGGRTKFQLEEAQAERTLAKAGEDLARAREVEARAQLDIAIIQAGYTSIKAPFAGVITRRILDSGALVRNGSQSGSLPIFEIERNDKIRCSIDISESDSILLLESAKHKTLAAHITFQAIGREIDIDAAQLATGMLRFSRTIHPRSHHMMAAIDLDNSDGSLIPGLFAKITLHARGTAASDVVLVPNTSAHAPRKGKTSVFVVLREGSQARVELRLVKFGATDGRRIEVLEGLKGDEEIVTRSSGTLLTGQEVTVKAAGGNS